MRGGVFSGIPASSVATGVPSMLVDDPAGSHAGRCGAAVGIDRA